MGSLCCVLQRSFLRGEEWEEGYEGVYMDPHDEDEDGDVVMRRFASEINLFTVRGGAASGSSQPQPAQAAQQAAAAISTGGNAGASSSAALLFAPPPAQQQAAQCCRPPSRQKDAFPVHLADLGDLLAPAKPIKRKDAFQVYPL